MTKNFTININKENTTNKFHMHRVNLAKCIVSGIAIGTMFTVLCPSSVYAVNIDLDRMGDTIFGGIQKFTDKYYPAGVFASGIGGMVAVPGDLKMKAIGFGTGALLAGLTVWGVKSGFGIA